VLLIINANKINRGAKENDDKKLREGLKGLQLTFRVIGAFSLFIIIGLILMLIMQLGGVQI